MNANQVLKALQGFEKRQLRCVDEILDILRVEKFEDFNFEPFSESDLKAFWKRVRMTIGGAVRRDRFSKSFVEMREKNTEVVEANIKTIWEVSQKLFSQAIRGIESVLKINGATIKITGDMQEVNFIFDGETEFFDSKVYNGESTSAHKYLYRVLKERAII